MKIISETKGIERLAEIRAGFSRDIHDDFEHKAKPCAECETPGDCCLDAHFVNVRISRLEAAAIRQALDQLSPEKKYAVFERVENAIDRFDLTSTHDSAAKTYACPLFENGIGCLIHDTAKPLPCIAHACYEKKEDLPPDELLAGRENEIDDLNKRVYGRSAPLLPLPVAIRR
ncbi:MAG: hypothetical protein KIT61_00480 [Pyrinomonadaceae bacterium]|nr:hypothetical protein [Blastocatellia bacterium]MCW5955027.1 hypothetical protein [Pyrinomonadaceae bacterium]